MFHGVSLSSLQAIHPKDLRIGLLPVVVKYSRNHLFSYRFARNIFFNYIECYKILSP